MKTNNHLPLRVVVYIFSLALLAFGVALAVKSNLGLSPVTSLPYSLSLILHIPLSIAIIGVYSAYVFMQILLLRKDFKPYLLLQLVFSIIFGYFVDFFKIVLGDFSLPTYISQLATVVFSALCIGIAVAMYMSVNIMPLPMEGLVAAITTALKGKVKFSVVKTACDSASVIIAASLSLLFLGKLVGVREGTVITALLLGPIVGLAQKYITPSIEKAVFAKTSQVNV